MVCLDRRTGTSRRLEIRGVLIMPTCKGCGIQIRWVKTENGKNMPVQANPIKAYILHPDFDSSRQYHLVDVYIPHFAGCPKIGNFRRKQK